MSQAPMASVSGRSETRAESCPARADRDDLSLFGSADGVVHVLEQEREANP